MPTVNPTHPLSLSNTLLSDSNVLSKVLTGHTDAVWQLALSGQKLLSCSADGSVRLWDSNLSEPLQSTINDHAGIPISIDWLMQDTSQFVVTYDTLKTVIYDTETGKVRRELINDESANGDSNYRMNRLVSHPSQPLIITAHDDRKIRYFDSNSGRIILQRSSDQLPVVPRSNDSLHGRASRKRHLSRHRSSTELSALQ